MDWVFTSLIVLVCMASCILGWIFGVRTDCNCIHCQEEKRTWLGPAANEEEVMEWLLKVEDRHVLREFEMAGLLEESRSPPFQSLGLLGYRNLGT